MATPDQMSNQISAELLVEAEKAVVGAILVSAADHYDLIYQVEKELTPADFGNRYCRLIYENMVELATEGQSIDIITLSSKLHAKGELTTVGGRQGLARLISATPTSAHCLDYVQVVAQGSARRSLSEAGDTISYMASRLEQDPKTAGDRSVDVLLSAIRPADRNNDNDVKTMIEGYINGPPAELERLRHITTPLHHLNQAIGGFKPKQVTVVGAKTGYGKTALVTGFAVEAAFQGKTTLLFSPEMDRQELASRIVSAESGVPYDIVHHGPYSDTEYDKIIEAVGKLSYIPLRVITEHRVSMPDIRRRAIEAHKTTGLDLLVIDHLQFLAPPNTGGDNGRFRASMRDNVSHISQELQLLASELDTSVIAVSQLNRNADYRQGPPRLSDLKESGNLEQDAQTVLLIHEEETDNQEVKNQPTRLRQIIIAKQRFGAADTINVWFHQPTTRYMDYQGNQREYAT